jgi:hypothetical protein
MASDFPGDRGVFAVRRFLASVAASVRHGREFAGRELAVSAVMPPDPGELWPTWEEFVPTTIRLASPLDEETLDARPDVDGSNPARFVTGIKIVDRERQYPGVRVQQVAVRAYLAPPARLTEVVPRAAYLAASGHSLPLEEGHSNPSDRIYGGLSKRERRQLGFVVPSESIAMAAVLAAADRPVVAFSDDASWPSHPLVRQVAKRLGCTIVRRHLDEIPPAVLRHIRIVRYRTITEGS